MIVPSYCCRSASVSDSGKPARLSVGVTHMNLRAAIGRSQRASSRPKRPPHANCPLQENTWCTKALPKNRDVPRKRPRPKQVFRVYRHTNVCLCEQRKLLPRGSIDHMLFLLVSLLCCARLSKEGLSRQARYARSGGERPHDRPSRHLGRGRKRGRGR